MTDDKPKGPLHRIVVDTETTGLTKGVDVAVEVAWWDLATDEQGSFIPPHGDFDMDHASPAALDLNGYWRRGLDNPNRWDDGTELARLHAVFAGAEGEDPRTLAGSNPHFDIAMLSPLFTAAGLAPEPWHHRVDPLEAYTRGRLGRRTLPGLAKVCELLGVDPGDHTAAGDVRATGECFRSLDDLGPLLLLDPLSEDDATALARAVLAIPDHQAIRAGDVAHGRRLLAKLAERNAG